MTEDDKKPLMLSGVPSWIKDLTEKYPNGARWNDERGSWEAVEPGDLDFKWVTDEIVPYDD